MGAFHSAISHLQHKKLFEPLRAYIRSGKPYFGICIGLQILFNASSEPPSIPGLGIIDDTISRFDDSDKTVPHIGWNSCFLSPSRGADTGGQTFYFVHSYRATLQNNDIYGQWACTSSQYGNESFVSSIQNGNIFATQFHPEKSGMAGLDLIAAWLAERSEFDPRCLLANIPNPTKSLNKRIIACLDVRNNDEGDLVVTKGDQYDVREQSVIRNLGKPVSLAARYYAEGADEICFLNITSFRNSPLRDHPMLSVVEAAAREVFVPLTIGGGIKDTEDPDGTKHSALEVAGLYFRAGADKVSIGSEAVFIVERALRGEDVTGNAISSIAYTYGNQAVVVSIDPKRVYVDDQEACRGSHHGELISKSPSQAWWYQCTVYGGRETRPLSVVQLAQGAEKLGAGEILVNSIDRDGTNGGFDHDLVRLIKRSVKIPVIASSGAGSAKHFVDLFKDVDVEAALAAGIFHRREVGISEVKDSLRTAGFSVRW